MLQSNKISIHAGLEHPVRILQLTDIHLSLADDIDGDEMKKHAEQRRQVFQKEANFPEKDPEGFLREAMEYGKAFDTTVITGDVLDFTSHANREKARDILAGYDYMFTAGNHEFCPRVGVPDSFARRLAVQDQIQSLFRGNMYFESRVVNGLNIVTIDNSCFMYTEDQYIKLKEELKKGLPIVVFTHDPLGDAQLKHDPPHKDLPVPNDIVALTNEVNEVLMTNDLIKGIFAGHWHNNSVQTLESGKLCYITGGLFKGIVSEITVD